MFIFWIIVAVLIGLGVLVMAYWTVLTSMYPETIHTNEVHIVATPDLWKLRLCRYRKGRSEGEPILFVHGFNSNQHNFIEPESGSMVSYLAAKGFDCWTVDLRGTRSSTPPFERSMHDVTMDDYIYQDIPSVIAHIQKSTGYARVHWVGHSMGGGLLYAYVTAHGAETIASGATLGAPLGFVDAEAKPPLLVGFLAQLFPATAGNVLRSYVPIGFNLRLATGLFPLNLKNIPKDLNTGHLYAMLEDPPPKVLKEFLFSMRKKVWYINDDQINMLEELKHLQVPLLAIYGPKDPFVNVEKATEFFENLPGKDKKLLILSKENGCVNDYSHCDLAFSQEGATEVYEPIAKWFKKHPIEERILLVDEKDSDYMPPLDEDARAGILSGSSFAHLVEGEEREEEEDFKSEKVTAAVEKAAMLLSMESEGKKAAPKKPAAKKKAAAKKNCDEKSRPEEKGHRKESCGEKSPRKENGRRQKGSKRQETRGEKSRPKEKGGRKKACGQEESFGEKACGQEEGRRQEISG